MSMKLRLAGMGGAAAQTYVDDVFSTYLYTGNGSTQTITNGIDLAGKGGMIWIKSRSAATDHKLTDTVRGATKALISDTTGAETTDSTGLTAFSSTGFSLGASSVYNTNAATYASWTFRKAAKFFDVVTWTGTGSARTIAHSLGVAPGMIIVKRTNAIDGWQIYHQSLGNSQAIRFSTAAAVSVGATYWQTTTPTSTEFYIGTDSSVNGSGSTYVAYLYAHDTSSTGIIQCGSFTTDGSGNATVNLGWEPQYVLAKGANAETAWTVSDTMRGMSANTSGTDAILIPNLSAAETAASDGFAPNSTGFTAWGWATSTTHIYMAIRRPNKPPTTGTQVFESVARTTTNPNLFTTALTYVDMAINRRRATSPSTPLLTSRLTGTGGLVTSSTASEITTQASYAYNYQINPDYYDAIGGTEIDWLFKRAPGFFDVVCYTSAAGAPEPHNLGVVPELIISKVRNISGQNWFVNSPTLLTTYGKLNLTDAWAGDATPYSATATTFKPISYGSSKNMVSYLFATLAGISKVGSYTGTGAAQNIDCGFTGGARFVMIKRTDSTSDWGVFDTARGIVAAQDPMLTLNNTAAEVTVTDFVDPYAQGFALAGNFFNNSGGNYIFLAIA